jgi:hypothetical protein
VLDVYAPAPAPSAHAAVQPDRIDQGTSAGLTGTGYAAGEKVQVRDGSLVLTTVTADAQGSFAVLIGAQLKPGRHTLTVAGGSSGRSAETILTVAQVTATITLSPTTVRAGATVAVSGDHFLAGEEVGIRLGGSLLQSVHADGKGRFSRVLVHIPRNLRTGRYVLAASGNHSKRSAAAPIRVNEIQTATTTAITLSSSRVRAGQTVVVKGSGFGAGEIVLISLRGAVATAAMSDPHGSFTMSLAVPAKAQAGPATITCSGVKSHKHAQATVLILAA